MIANLKHWAILAFAGLCLLAGAATIWLPIPTGVPLLALGLFLIIANSRMGRRLFRKLRKHVDWLDHALLWLEDRAGQSVGRVLKTTRPLMTRHRRRAEMEAARPAGSPPVGRGRTGCADSEPSSAVTPSSRAPDEDTAA